MRLIGLTGGIASGKSAAARLIQAAGVPVVDVDRIVHRIEAVGERGWRTLFRLLGFSVLRPDGSLDRMRLGRWLFADAGLRERVNRALHPLIRQDMWREVKKLEDAGHAVVVVDVPLLIESGLTSLVDAVWVVWATPEQQIERLMARSGLSRDAAARRLQSQWPLRDKLAYAHRVLDNTGDLTRLEQQVKEALGDLAR